MYAVISDIDRLQTTALVTSLLRRGRFFRQGSRACTAQAAFSSEWIIPPSCSFMILPAISITLGS